jgi:predicted DNA-binding antitoxin AbrB/MazE fold protein
MDTVVNAVFRNGVFVPTTTCDIPENTEVRVIVQGSTIIPPVVTDPAERARIRREVIEAMRRNPIPADAPHFTREQLHERR